MVITTTFREGARRVIGATAKPLYAIDGKAGGLDRRNPQTSLLEGGGPPAGGGRSSLSPSPSTGFPRRSRPPALSSIAYRGFAVAPITLRLSRRHLPVSSVSPSQRPPSSREGDRPQAVEGVPAHRAPYHPSRALSEPFIQPRVQGRNPARFKGGYGVPRGFKGGSKPSAPCGRLSEAEHPKRKGATLLRPLSAVNRNLPLIP